MNTRTRPPALRFACEHGVNEATYVVPARQPPVDCNECRPERLVTQTAVLSASADGRPGGIKYTSMSSGWVVPSSELCRV